MDDIEVCCSHCRKKYQCVKLTRKGQTICCCFNSHKRNSDGELICCQVCIDMKINCIENNKIDENLDFAKCRICERHVTINFGEFTASLVEIIHEIVLW
jgi:hypothetical protein